LSQVNWSDRSAGRRRVLAWCDDSRISAADLSIVTAFLVGQANVPGLDDSLVIAPEADASARAAGRQKISDAWTIDDDSEAVTLARSDLVDWVRRVQPIAFGPTPAGSEVEALAHLVTLAEWNDAANLLWHGRSSEAELVLIDLEPALAAARLAGPDPNRERHRFGSSQDNRFPIEYSQALQANDRMGMKDLIEALGGPRTETVGPLTAEFLVDIALGSKLRDNRATALDKIAGSYGANPLVIFALADNMLPGQSDVRLSNTIENITGVKLPPVRSEHWYAQARIALLTHTAHLRGLYDEPTPTDAMIALLATSYERQATTMVNSLDSIPVVSVGSHGSLRAVQRLFDEYLAQARPMQPRVSVPARLDVDRSPGRPTTRSVFGTTSPSSASVPSSTRRTSRRSRCRWWTRGARSSRRRRGARSSSGRSSTSATRSERSSRA
jgi:hypothetical protein